LLKENNFDWNKAKEVFYSMTEPQILWFNITAATEKRRLDDEAEAEANRRSNVKGKGFGGTEINKRSFTFRD